MHILCGLLAGFVATVPMTFLMFIIFYYVPKKEDLLLPPMHLVRVFVKKVDLKEYIEPTKHKALSFVHHFGYGALAGALFGMLEGYVLNFFILKGVLFGLFIWILSYFILIPSIGLFPLPDRRPVRFNLLMIVSHIMWGILLAFSYLFFLKECQKLLH